MKLAGLYSIRDIPRLRANHRAFAERNMMDYVELFCGNFYEKWALVYWLLDSEPHETFVFIDAFSYFVSPDFDLDCSDPVVIQELNGKVMDNFFVVRSCPESRKLFSEVGTMASQRFIGDLSFYFDVPDSAGVAKPYGFRTIGGKHFNVDLGFAQEGHFPGIKDLPVGFEFSEGGNEADGALDAGEMLVATFAGQGWVAQCGSVAEVLCCHRCHLDQPDLSTGLEVVNPGCERALLTLSCCEPGEPFPEYVSVSERNLRRYAKEANVTLYLYKGIPPEYAGLHSTWTKPYLALRHLVDHGYLSWVDGDVLLSRDFALPEGQDVVVYKDPGAWLFNAGFITFRRSEKTFDYLRAVIARCEALDDRSSLYVNGSDQTQFIEEFQAHFPDLLPRSNLVANIPILLQSIRQAGPGLWHFMGLNPASIRTVVMDYYDKYVIDSHLSDRPAAIKSKPGKSETARPTPGTKEIESQTTPSIHGFARIADKAVGQMWLINLPRRADRLEKFKANHPDIADYINVLPAYDGKKLRLTPKIARLFAPNDFGWNKATMGCSLSHLELWQKLADEPAEDARYLILEDDTRLSPEWLQTLQEAFARQDVPADWDVLYLGGVLPHNETVFAQCKEQVSGKVFRVVPNGWFGQQPPNRYFHFGAYAYLLSKSGARKMLEFIRLQNGIWPQADYILSYVTPADYPVQTSHYFFEPLLAHCYQDMESGYSRSYEDKGQPGKIDSDIWKESSAFDKAEAERLFSLSESYDIPGALTEARAQMGLVDRTENRAEETCPAKQKFHSARHALAMEPNNHALQVDMATALRGLYPAEAIAVVPSRSNIEGAMCVLRSLEQDRSVREAILVADGEEAFKVYAPLVREFKKVRLERVELGAGIHVMWNIGVNTARRFRAAIAFVNDDVVLEDQTIGTLASLLAYDASLGLVCPAYDSRVFTDMVQDTDSMCQARYDGSGGLAGFCMVLAPDLAQQWRFDESMKWWYGDNDVLLWVLHRAKRRAAIASIARCGGNESKTIENDPPPDFGRIIENDRKIFLRKWSTS